MLCKRDCADDNLIHGLIAKAGFLKDQHIPIDACEDISSLLGIDQDDSAWGFLVAFPEQSCLLLLSIVE